MWFRFTHSSTSSVPGRTGATEMGGQRLGPSFFISGESKYLQGPGPPGRRDLVHTLPSLPVLPSIREPLFPNVRSSETEPSYLSSDSVVLGLVFAKVRFRYSTPTRLGPLPSPRLRCCPVVPGVVGPSSSPPTGTPCDGSFPQSRVVPHCL